VGKATLAYRIARYVLRFGATAGGPANLSVPKNDVVSRQIEAQAHPGLMVLKRRENDRGKLKTVLDVDEVRRLGGFFGMTAGAGGWRVAIVDAADEMNDNAANALLKILEEPPARGLLLLISHAPGRLLPTIRSRAQRLDLKPLERPVLNDALKNLQPDLGDDDRTQLIDVSDGSLGLALRLAGEEGLKLAREAESLLGARTLDIPAVLSLGERIGRGADGLGHFGSFLIQAIARRVRERATKGEGDHRAVELWEQLNALYERAALVHMEPRETVLISAREIANAKRRGAI
jgi:DNA polymerase-3 subunit delta'